MHVIIFLLAVVLIVFTGTTMEDKKVQEKLPCTMLSKASKHDMERTKLNVNPLTQKVLFLHLSIRKG